MKTLLHGPVALALSLLLHACGDAPPAAASSGLGGAGPSTALEVVNQRMAAYNRHDLGAFLDTYSEGVEIFTYPDRSLGKGKDHMRSLFEPMFEEGRVQVTLHHQIAKDGYVVNHETVSDGDTATEYVSIYEVRDGKIQSVRFVRD